MKSLLAALLFSALPLFANATVITIGAISRDPTQNYMMDNLNNRTWMGWDKTFGYTLAETILETNFGGKFEGYKVAQNIDAQMFIDAMVGAGNPCNITNNIACAENISGIARVTGRNYYNIPGKEINYITFIDDQFSDSIGIIEALSCLQAFCGSDMERLFKQNSWSTLSNGDYFSKHPDTPFGYMLYKDMAVPVPEPSTRALLGLAIAALIWSQRRRY